MRRIGGSGVRMYHVDAFTDTLFCGNPAGVCILGDQWLDATLMQKIAMENNMAETSFVIQKDGMDGMYQIRWFTPVCEVSLCGHATLATAHVLFHHENALGEELKFASPREILGVKKQRDLLMLDFSADSLRSIDFSDELDCFNSKPLACYVSTTEYLLVFSSENEIANLECDVQKAAKICEQEGFICTAKGDNVDFVSRYFAPKIGIPEDAVTGSAHTVLAPYWASVLGKTELQAVQLSPRRGWLHCQLVDSRVIISGKAVTYSINELLI